jgi:hypothetical protein
MCDKHAGGLARIVPIPPRPPKQPGPMLSDLEEALGSLRAVQEAISAGVLVSRPGRLRMDVVSELWLKHCGSNN